MPGTLPVCPICSSRLTVSRLSCDGCGARIEARLQRCRFCGMDDEAYRFIELFLRNRGNLSGAAADLGISFPTASRRLDSALEALGLRGRELAGDARTDLREGARSEILAMLERGEIGADEAAKRLRRA